MRPRSGAGSALHFAAVNACDLRARAPPLSRRHAGYALGEPGAKGPHPGLDGLAGSGQRADDRAELALLEAALEEANSKDYDDPHQPTRQR